MVDDKIFKAKCHGEEEIEWMTWQSVRVWITPIDRSFVRSLTVSKICS